MRGRHLEGLNQKAHHCISGIWQKPDGVLTSFMLFVSLGLAEMRRVLKSAGSVDIHHDNYTDRFYGKAKPLKNNNLVGSLTNTEQETEISRTLPCLDEVLRIHSGGEFSSRVFRLNEKHCRSEGAGFANFLQQKGVS